jgi:hypothetical protein
MKIGSVSDSQLGRGRNETERRIIDMKYKNDKI